MRLHISRYRCNWLILLCVVSVTLIPLLGVTLFNTKGEPREAIVALNMLDSGEWLLPMNYGADIPYKPPMLAWLIAAVSWLFGGHVSEFSSRLPSAIACVAMVMVGFSVFTKHRTQSAGRTFSSAAPMAMAVVTFTAFEVQRAATSCRVDMVLTSFIVCAIYCFYLFYDTHRVGYVCAAVVLMAMATLTKGPVGIILPCAIIWIYRLTRGASLWPLTATLALCAILALIPYVWWFVEAMQRGGDEFTRLMIEENFGRFTGTMSYSSHSNPWWYYVPALAAGFLPYTLLALLGLCLDAKWRKPDLSNGFLHRLWCWFRRLEPLDALSLIAIVFTVVFYIIPDSKRSVYLLPIYPFVAWFMVRFLRYICCGRGRSVRAYGWFIGVVAVAVPLLFAVIKFGLLSFLSGSVADTIRVLNEAQVAWWQLVLIILSVVAGVATMVECHKSSAYRALGMTLATTVVLYWSLAGVYSPIILNSRSAKAATEQILKAFPDEQHFYSMTHRLYEVNYYMADRMRLIERELPDRGVAIGVIDMDRPMRDSLPQYDFDLVWMQSDAGFDSNRKSPLAAWRFALKPKRH